MKQAVVFYSRDGSTRVIAKAIAKKVGAEAFELKEKSPIKGFMAAAWGAMRGKKSELIDEYTKECAGCDKLFVGTPVWGGKAVPAVNMFFGKTPVNGKEIVFFTVQGGKTSGKPIGGAKRMVSDLIAKGAKSASAISFTGGSSKIPVDAKSAEEQVMARL